MPIIEGPVSAAVMGVGLESGSGGHVSAKPDPCGALGHYRVSHRHVMVNAQAANSRFFEIRNQHATQLIVIKDIRIEWVQTAAHTVAIMDSIDLYRVTSFSVIDPTGTVTLTASKLRASYATLVDGTDIQIRGVTVAGLAGGCSGGTLTKDAAPLRQIGQWLLAAVPTAGTVIPIVGGWTPQVAHGEGPLALVQNEGLIIENRVLLGAAAGSAVSIDVSFLVATAY